MKPRRILIVAAISITAIIGVVVGWNAYSDVERNFRESEAWIVPPVIDDKSLSEVGYIRDTSRQIDFKERKRVNLWWVRIPETDRIYSCEWESGYSNFATEDAVMLIHTKDDSSDSGFIVGMHGQQKGRSARIWAIDMEKLY
jgi:hypothetical protein